MKIKYRKNGLKFEGYAIFKDGVVFNFNCSRGDIIEELQKYDQVFPFKKDDEKFLKDYLAYKEKIHIKDARSKKKKLQDQEESDKTNLEIENKSPINIVSSFVKEYLNNEIDKLGSFYLGNLVNDKTYGCPGRKFDPDDTELMRAIYCIVFGKAWGDISMHDLGEGKLRGDTINTYNTLFSPPWKERFTAIWDPNSDLKEKIKKFKSSCYTVGNMTLLPDKRIGEWSINKHRGCHDDWHDYEDRFLAALYKVLTKKDDRDLDLEELVEANHYYFKPYYGESGWKRFVINNMLEYYVDELYRPIISSKGYTYWRGGYTNRDRFLTECHRYIDFTMGIINKRAKRIIDIIKENGTDI